MGDTMYRVVVRKLFVSGVLDGLVVEDHIGVPTLDLAEEVSYGIEKDIVTGRVVKAAAGGSRFKYIDVNVVQVN
jgi:hypothetical protein